MAYVNDAQTLADVVSPAAAAAQMGIQNDAANQQQQIANTTAQGQQAAEIAKPGLQNMFTQAQTANEQAVTQQNQSKALLGQATLPGEIGSTNAANTASMSASQAKSVGQIGQIAGQVAGIMDGIPAFQRPDAMQKVAQSYDIDPDKLGPLMNGDPDMLRQVSQKAIQASAAYQTDYMGKSMENQGKTDVANIDQAGGIQKAQITADARTQVATLNRQVAQQKLTIDQQIGQLTQKIGTPNEQPGDRNRLQDLQKYSLSLRDMQAQTTRALMGLGDNSGTGNNPAAPQDTIPSAQGQGGNAPVSSPGPAIQQSATAAFGAYEPDKYNYRIGPDGTPQRKAK